jgi:tRNA (guanine-N(7)-)-methyltransferase subunit TRM82
VLDLTTLDSNGSLVVSVDAVRAPGSTDTWKESPVSAQSLTECLQIGISDGGLKWAVSEDSRTACINASGTSGLSAKLDAKQKKAIDDTLYNLGNLRKRTFDD